VEGKGGGDLLGGDQSGVWVFSSGWEKGERD